MLIYYVSLVILKQRCFGMQYFYDTFENAQQLPHDPHH